MKEVIATISVVFAFFFTTYVGAGLLIGSDPFFFTRPIVYLQEYDGKEMRSRIYHDEESGKDYSYFSAASRVGPVWLNPDHTTTSVYKGETDFIEHWSKVRTHSNIPEFE